jgi:hypothetical protein
LERRGRDGDRYLREQRADRRHRPHPVGADVAALEVRSDRRRDGEQRADGRRWELDRQRALRDVGCLWRARLTESRCGLRRQTGVGEHRPQAVALRRAEERDERRAQLDLPALEHGVGLTDRSRWRDAAEGASEPGAVEAVPDGEVDDRALVRWSRRGEHPRQLEQPVGDRRPRRRLDLGGRLQSERPGVRERPRERAR